MIQKYHWISQNFYRHFMVQVKKMTLEIDFKIELMLIVVQDKRTGYNVAYFEQFPKASASAETPIEANAELTETSAVMFREKKKISRGRLLITTLRARLEFFKKLYTLMLKFLHDQRKIQRTGFR